MHACIHACVHAYMCTDIQKPSLGDFAFLLDNNKMSTYPVIVNDKSVVTSFENNFIDISYEVQGNIIFMHIVFPLIGNHVYPE